MATVKELERLIAHPYWMGDEELHVWDHACAEGYMKKLWMLQKGYPPLPSYGRRYSKHILVRAECFRYALGVEHERVQFEYKVDCDRFSDREHVILVANNRLRWKQHAPMYNLERIREAERVYQEACSDRWKEVGKSFIKEPHPIHIYSRWKQFLCDM
jgi:hypothetical protein